MSTYRIGTVHIPAPADAVGTPIDSPTFGLPPSRFTDGEVLTLQYATDPVAIRALLPEPLEPINDTVQVQVSRWGSVPGAGHNIHECNVMVGARYRGSSGIVEGSYSPYFWVQSDRSMVGGREFHGQPKRIAEISLYTVGDLHVGRVRHNGIEVFTGTLQYKPHKSTFDRLRSRIDLVTNFNLKIVNHIDSTPAIKQLTSRDLTDIEIHECYEGPCTVEVRPTATAPLYRLPPLEFLEGFYWRTDFSLVGGHVLHDYLARPQDALSLSRNAMAGSTT